MSGPRLVLFFDRDPSLPKWIRSLPISQRFEIEVADPASGAVERVKATKPSLIFIAVDLPGKEGFALFNEIRRAVKKTAIVLTTSSLPAGDMNLHAKLKIHADAYLDKTTLTGEGLLKCLNDLLPLNLSAEDIAALSAGVPRLVTAPGGEEAPGPAARSSSADDQVQAPGGGREPPRWKGTSRVARLKAGMRLGWRELDSAGPPSGEGMNQGSEPLEERPAPENRARTVGAKGRRAPGAGEPEISEEPLEVEGDLSRLPQQEARRLREEAENLERENMALTMQFEARLEQERLLQREAQKRHDSELVSAKRRADEDRAGLEREHAARLEALGHQWNEERARLLTEHQAELQQLTREREKALDSARRRENEVSALQAAHQEVLTRQATKVREAVESARKAALAEAEDGRRAALAESEQRRVADRDAAEKRFLRDLELREDEHRKQMAEAEQKERAALEQVRAASMEKQEAIQALEQWRRRYEETCRSLETEMESLREELARAKGRSQRDVETEALVKKLERDVAEAIEAGRRDKDALEVELRANLEEARLERVQALKTCQEEHERQLATLRAEHQAALAAKEEALVILSGILKSRQIQWGEQMDQLKEAQARQIQARREESEARLDQLRKEHEETLNALRRELEAKTSSAPGVSLKLADLDNLERELEAANARLEGELGNERRKVEQCESELTACDAALASLKGLLADLYQSMDQHVKDGADPAGTIHSLMEVIETYVREQVNQHRTIASLRSLVGDAAQESARTESV